MMVFNSMFFLNSLLGADIELSQVKILNFAGL